MPFRRLRHILSSIVLLVISDSRRGDVKVRSRTDRTKSVETIGFVFIFFAKNVDDRSTKRDFHALFKGESNFRESFY